MQYRAFGETGWQVSEIGFGGWQLGGMWGDVDDSESIDTLLYAFDQGINLVDTAALYGAGRSEKVIGKALKQWRSDDKRDQMYAKGGGFLETLSRIEKVSESCSHYYSNLAEAALRFALHPRQVALTIPGMRNRQEVDLYTIHSDGQPFPVDFVGQLAPHAWEHVFY